MYFRIFCENTTKNKNLFIFLGVGVVSLVGIGFYGYKYCKNKKNNSKNEIEPIINETGKIDYKSKDVEKYFYHFIKQEIFFVNGVEQYVHNFSGINYHGNQKVNEIREFCKKINEFITKNSSCEQYCDYLNVIMKEINKFDTGSNIFTVFKKIVNEIKFSDEDKKKLSQCFGNNDIFKREFSNIIKNYGIQDNEIGFINTNGLIYVLINIIQCTQLKTEYEQYLKNREKKQK